MGIREDSNCRSVYLASRLGGHFGPAFHFFESHRCPRKTFANGEPCVGSNPVAYPVSELHRALNWHSGWRRWLEVPECPLFAVFFFIQPPRAGTGVANLCRSARFLTPFCILATSSGHNGVAFQYFSRLDPPFSSTPPSVGHSRGRLRGFI